MPPSRCSKRCRMNARCSSSRTPPASTTTTMKIAASSGERMKLLEGFSCTLCRPGNSARRPSTIAVTADEHDGQQQQAAQDLAPDRPGADEDVARSLAAEVEKHADQQRDERRVEQAERREELERRSPSLSNGRMPTNEDEDHGDHELGRDAADQEGLDHRKPASQRQHGHGQGRRRRRRGGHRHRRLRERHHNGRVVHTASVTAVCCACTRFPADFSRTFLVDPCAAHRNCRPRAGSQIGDATCATAAENVCFRSGARTSTLTGRNVNIWRYMVERRHNMS